MSRYISKLFQAEKPQEQPKPNIKRVYDSKKLPPDFAEQILVHDIILELSQHSSKESLHALVQLYMRGVEYYESLQDERQQYFKKKLQLLMSHPKILQQSQAQTKQVMSISNNQQQVIQSNKVYQKQKDYEQNSNFQSHQNTNFQSHMPTIQSVLKDDESVWQFNDDDQPNVEEKQYTEDKQYTEEKQNIGSKKFIELKQNIDVQQKEEKEEIVLQTMKQEIFLHDDKRQVKQMMASLKRDSLQINQLIQEEIEQQSQKITNRLRQRSTGRFSMNRASSQPVFQRFGFKGGSAGLDSNQPMETEGNESVLDISNTIKEDYCEHSQAASRRPSTLKIDEVEHD